MTLRALIVDDERHARAELRTLLAAHPAVEIVGEAADLDAATTALTVARPNLVFLDIALGAHSGFDLLDAMDSRCRVIFVTAYDAYAVRAFEVNALDYLLKPIHPERLAATIARAESHDPALFFKCGDTGAFVKVTEIVCVLADGDYSRVITTTGREHLVLRSLADWERRLPADRFARIHRSAIANLTVATDIRRGRDGRWRVYLPTLTKPLIVSRRSARYLNRD
jgi:two-component system, LytTR family, response regulator